jgi:hypothetical protein
MEETEEEKKTLLADEFLLVRHSGEIPEVALESAIYYLTEDPEGPYVTLDPDDRALLQKAAVDRYREIILRDLDPANRDMGMYRGVARCIVNWQRFLKFCQKVGHETRAIREDIAQALLDFLGREIKDVQSGSRNSCVNCDLADFKKLLDSLDLHESVLPAGWPCLWE